MAFFLTLKAEVVTGVHLVLRHRAPKLAMLLTGVVLLLVLVTSLDEAERGRHPETVLLITGTLAAVSGSRLLTPGAALHAARRVAASRNVVAVGRLLGATLVVLPLASGAVLLIGADTAQVESFLRLVIAVVVYTLAIAAVTMALAPTLGASAAATLGFLFVWIGGLPPSGVSTLLDPLPSVRAIAVFSWNVLPLHWRAVRSFADPQTADLWFLLGWFGAALLAASWHITTVAKPGDAAS